MEQVRDIWVLLGDRYVGRVTSRFASQQQLDLALLLRSSWVLVRITICLEMSQFMTGINKAHTTSKKFILSRKLQAMINNHNYKITIMSLYQVDE